MNLPHPFDNASGVKADAQGSFRLIDRQGKSLARIPMNTAFELSSKSEGYGHGSHGFGSGSGFGYGDGYSYGQGYGSGSGKSK